MLPTVDTAFNYIFRFAVVSGPIMAGMIIGQASFEAVLHFGFLVLVIVLLLLLKGAELRVQIVCRLLMTAAVGLAIVETPDKLTRFGFVSVFVVPIAMFPSTNIIGSFILWAGANVVFMYCFLVLCPDYQKDEPVALAMILITNCFYYAHASWGAYQRTMSRVAAIEKLKKQLQIAHAEKVAKIQFLSTMSHELRTPMHGVLGMLLVAREATTNKEVTDHLETANSAAKHLLFLIDNFSDFSKLHLNQMVVACNSFNLTQVAQNVVRVLSQQANDKGLKLEVDSSSEVWALGDEDRASQIVFNLVGNAIKFTKSGLITVRVSERTMCQLVVEDTGIGIPATRLASVFDPFVQADDSVTRRYGGTGLGLTISRDLARLMQGDLTVTSQVHVGSAFSLSLPIAKKGSSRKSPTASEQHPLLHHCRRPSTTPGALGADSSVRSTSPVRSFVPPTTPRLRVLMAEDNAINAKIASKFLLAMGHQIRHVWNGEEALEELLSSPEHYDFVLMDMQMPVLDGLEATRLLRQKERELGLSPHYVVALTANAMQSDNDLCKAAGMNEYISKPFSPPQLAGICQRVANLQQSDLGERKRA